MRFASPIAKFFSSPSSAPGRDLLLVTIVAVAVLLPIIIIGIPNGADLPNHLRFAQPFYDSIRAGHWQPGWLAESNDGFGDPRFRFYPPGLYYLLAAGRTLTSSWYSGSLLVFVFLSVLGAAGTYFWARSFFPANAAMCAGILYSLAPFHLNELYQASLLSEYAACAVLPFAFAFTERICRKRNLVNVAGLAAAFASLVLMHLPLTVIGSISLALYALLRIEKKAWLGTVCSLAAAIGLGLAASAFYWMTMLAELSWIKGNAGNPNPYYDYRLNFLFSPSALTNRNTWYANILALAMIGFLLPGLVLLRRLLRGRRKDKSLMPVAIVTIVSFIFATALSRPLWAMIPKLSEVQFPWRWLSITSLCGSVLVAASLARWRVIFASRLRPRNLAVAFAFLASLGFVVSQIVVEADYFGRERFEAMARDVRGAPSFKDWLPVGALDLLHVDLKRSKVDAGSRSVAVQAWEPEIRRFHVEPGPETDVRVRTYYYPHWVASANGRSLPARAAADGAILISLPASAADVTLTFQEPARVRAAEILSLLGWSIIAAFGLSRLARKIESNPALVLANTR